MDTLTNDAIIGPSGGNRHADGTGLRQIEADHRIANSLQIAAAVLMQERRRIADVDAAKAALDATAARLIAIGRLHRTLAQVSTQADVDLASILAPLRAELADCIGTTLRIDVGGVSLPASVAAQIGVVVSEMATNAAKHAQGNGTAPVLTVEADTNGLGEVRLRLYDDGPGFPEGFSLDAGSGIGLAVIVSTIKRIGGYVYVMPRFGPYAGTGAGIEVVLPPQGPRYR